MNAVRDPARDPTVPLPRIEGAAFSGTHVPLIERYRERLPFEVGGPVVVSLQRGRHAAAAGAVHLRDGRRRGAPEGRGRKPNRLVQGSRHDLRRLRRGARRVPRP